MEILYLDNAATSFPKPDTVMAAMIAYQQNIGANPGRSGHGRSVEAGRIVVDPPIEVEARGDDDDAVGEPGA